MCKRLLIVASVMFMAAPAFAAVGIFDFTADVGGPEGIGSTVYVAVDRYLISGGGNDIWGNADQFHYAYNEVSGNIRLSMKPSWQADGDNDWSKNEVMLRESLAAGSVFYATATRGGGASAPGYKGDSVFSQWRPVADNGCGGVDWWGAIPDTLGIQRITSNGYQIVQAIVDQGTGNGWEAVHTQWVPGLADNLLAGIAVTSHQNNNLVQAWADDVTYDRNPSLVGIPVAGDPLPEACGDRPGFLVTVAQMPAGWGWWDEDGEGGIDGRGWQYILGEYLVKNAGFTGFWEGDPTEYPAAQYGKRVVEFVNLHDSGGRWNFYEENGYPDESFPGIDTFEKPTTDPANGDDEDNFAVLVEACIELTEGTHVIGGAFDDGILIRIGGVEIGRTNAWDETSAWVFEAPAAGVYSFEAIGFEGGGGAQLEIYEYLPDGTRLLLGDGPSAVYVPEPATIALLGFGGLSLLRIRRKR